MQELLTVKNARMGCASQNRVIEYRGGRQRHFLASKLLHAPKKLGQKQSTSMAMKTHSIIFVSMEVAPWSKTGGLGDVVGALPLALAARGNRVATISPRYDKYPDIKDTEVRALVKWHNSAQSFTIPEDLDTEEVRYFHRPDNGVDRIFVDHPCFSARILSSADNPMGKTGNKIYGYDSSAEYSDNDLRFSLVCQAALEAALKLALPDPKQGGKKAPYGEDVVFVANDWHTGVLPCFLNYVYKKAGKFSRAAVALCLHNIAYQGRYPINAFPRLNLPKEALPSLSFVSSGKTYPGMNNQDQKDPAGVKINWLKAGFLESDVLLTVSPGYAHEVMSGPEMGIDLDAVLHQVGGICGVVNGMDDVAWNPADDAFLDPSLRFSADDMAGKARAKAALQKQFGLTVSPDAPLIGFVGRLEEQKGMDILMTAVPILMEDHPRLQLAFLGSGKRDLEEGLQQLEKKYPGRAKGIAAFSNAISHQITAGCDYMMVPSRFEPCGLVQMNAMRYGTIPIVASTGGLVDTVPPELGFQIGVLKSKGLVPQSSGGAAYGLLEDCAAAEIKKMSGTNPFCPESMCEDTMSDNCQSSAIDPSDIKAMRKTVAVALTEYNTEAFHKMRERGMRRDWSWKVPAAEWEAILEKAVESRS
eukprot:jgi/Mesvir1/4697/Mv21592-RA.1